MSGSTLWFIGISLSLPLAWLAGCRMGRTPDATRRGVYLGVAVGVMILWAWLIRHPAVAVNVIPLSVLARLEGVGAAPVFMFVVGIAWSFGQLKRQRAIVVVAVLLATGYFYRGGFWMLQQTPVGVFADETHPLEIRQSQDYSCVPAACATTLQLLHVETNEAEMARLTETRPGSGATLIRALHGLKLRLADEGIEAQLISSDYEQLRALSPPMLTPLQYEPARLHMVTILQIDEHQVTLVDPVAGPERLSRQEFESLYRGQVIAFESVSDR